MMSFDPFFFSPLTWKMAGRKRSNLTDLVMEKGAQNQWIVVLYVLAPPSGAF